MLRGDTGEREGERRRNERGMERIVSSEHARLR